MIFPNGKLPKQLYFLLAVMAGVTWGTHGVFAGLLGNYGVSEGSVAVISPLFLFLFFLAAVIKDDFRKLKIPKKLTPVLIFYGVLTALFNLAMVKAYLYMSAGIVHTIVFGNLFLLMIFSRIVFKTPLTVGKALLCALAVAGIALTLNVFGEGGTFSAAGVVWSLLTMVGWAGMVICEKYLLEAGVDANVVLVWDGGLGVVFLSFVAPPWILCAEMARAVAVSGGMVLLPLAGLALIATVLSYFCYIRSLKRLEPTYVQLGYVMDPLTATVLGLVFFHQTLTLSQVLGIVLILGLVIIVQVSEIRAAGKEGAPPAA